MTNGLFSLTFWVFGNPQDFYPALYWNVGENGPYTFAFPMVLNESTARVIAQFMEQNGEILTEYGLEFTIK